MRARLRTIFDIICAMAPRLMHSETCLAAADVSPRHNINTEVSSLPLINIRQRDGHAE